MRSEELIKLGVRSYIYNICTCVRAQEGGLYITNLQRWSLLMDKGQTLALTVETCQWRVSRRTTLRGSNLR